ncbi:hypothetical protein ACFP9V_23235 [Deinococcus radiopugnans]|uniref:Uncharacterized protein n=1 Tax=Deinococcus radiopugnans ATCC 19172 TaxID=585398 RepID=A0A5C4Y6P5_9DEIO|nr:hypothetical protein [Deinococcus radiopugnans]MBB6017163.1 hypothetical protein [Deinococcus radiopugnans ATCC 19172]TNM70616.1 hypothetical protein FHR04_11975 [Deinococcus radiopugnans ATCC 19172]
MNPPLLKAPEQWLGYVSAHLAPCEKDRALAGARARVAGWREEGLSDADILRELGDAGLAARGLEAQYLTREEEARLRPLMGWNPWRVTLACLAVLALSLGFEFWEHRSLSPWNLLVVAYGAVVTTALLWLRGRVSPWVWASLGTGQFALLFPLLLLTSTIRHHETNPVEAAIPFALALLVSGLAYVFAPARRKLEHRPKVSTGLREMP